MVLKSMDMSTRSAKNKGYKVFKLILKAPKVDLITAVDVIEHMCTKQLQNRCYNFMSISI
jgi:hypothetical protein